MSYNKFIEIYANFRGLQLWANSSPTLWAIHLWKALAMPLDMVPSWIGHAFLQNWETGVFASLVFPVLTKSSWQGRCSLAKKLNLAVWAFFHLICCMVSHCYHTYTSECLFHPFKHHLTTFTFIQLPDWYHDISRDCVIIRICRLFYFHQFHRGKYKVKHSLDLVFTWPFFLLSFVWPAPPSECEG